MRHVYFKFFTMIFFLLLGSAQAAENYHNEILASGVSGNISVTLQGYGRTEDGLLEEIVLNIHNSSESEVYEVLFDDRLVRQFWLVIEAEGQVLNNPLEGIEQPSMHGMSLNLLRIEPEQKLPFIIEINTAANVEANVYSEFEKVDLYLHIDMPIYAEGADTDKDDRIDMIRIRSNLKEIPVLSSVD